MHDPDTMIGSLGPITLWHHDPCKDGSDDSCGWFKRAKHGKPEVLKAIRSRMDFDFDRVFKSYDDWDMDEKKAATLGIKPRHSYDLGLFHPSGDPNFSVMGIVLNLFQDGAWCYFKDKHGDTDAAWRESRKFMQRHLAEILLFAENPTDSLWEGIRGIFRITCKEPWNREEALDNYASCIYGWILRAERKWWQHPRWHIHHWRLHVRWWDFVPHALRRRMRPQDYPQQVGEGGRP